MAKRKKTGKSKADISNTAVRIFLQRVGVAYDQARGLMPFGRGDSDWVTIVSFFGNCCCFCYRKNTPTELIADHLIPANKTSLGLHAWGNVVPACTVCNSDKKHKPWRKYIEILGHEDSGKAKIARIESFLKHYRYDPNLNLSEIATNLYQDVGEVSNTLIELRLKQAQSLIQKIHSA